MEKERRVASECRFSFCFFVQKVFSRRESESGNARRRRGSGVLIGVVVVDWFFFACARCLFSSLHFLSARLGAEEK